MSTMKRSVNVPGALNREPGERSNRYNGIYLGTVKENRDTSRMGRLKVWIAELSSTEDDASSWITVDYASPFAGATPFESTGNDLKDFAQTQTSYGFWAVPPDVGNDVLVAFINGDATRGYWFACSMTGFMNQMIPGDGLVDETLHYGKETTSDTGPLPVGEYNRTKINGRAFKTPDTEKKPINPYKAGSARDQGLIFDRARGPNNSSSRRESPSDVYGFSSPGPLDDRTPDTLPYKSNAGSGPPKKGHRLGGSSLVFDDASDTEHVTLKTRSGAQIKIAESDGFVYINNSNGSAWVEISPSGHVDIYGAKSISARAQEDINLRADRDINMEAGRNINMRASKDYLSPEDVLGFITAYANTQQKTLATIFTVAQKRDYIKDFKETQTALSQGKYDLDKAFFAALAENGFDVKSINPNLKFTPEQEAISRTTLTSIDLLHVLRGSLNVGQSYGSGGNISMYAFNDLAVIAKNQARLSTYDNGIDIMSGKQINATAATTMSLVAGSDLLVTSGGNADISVGSELKQLVGGNYLLNILNDWSSTIRGDINVRHEGVNLKFEGIPTEFTSSGRSASSTPHNVEIKAGKVASQYAEIKTKIDGEYDVQASIGRLLIDSGYSVEAGSQTNKINGTLATTATSITQKSSGVITLEGTTATFHGTTTNIYGDGTIEIKAPNINSTETAAPGMTLGSISALSDVPDVSPGTLQVNRPTSGTIARYAETYDILYAKSNVLPLLSRDGNKEYSITYHRQEIETIVRRFLTHEPCIEHEISGDTEILVPLFKDHLKFRILD